MEILQLWYWENCHRFLGFFWEMYHLFHLENSQSQTVRLIILVKAITVSLPSSCLRSETCNILTCRTGPLVLSFLARRVALELLVSLAYAGLYALCLFLVLHQKLSSNKALEYLLLWSKISRVCIKARSLHAIFGISLLEVLVCSKPWEVWDRNGLTVAFIFFILSLM